MLKIIIFTLSIQVHVRIKIKSHQIYLQNLCVVGTLSFEGQVIFIKLKCFY